MDLLRSRGVFFVVVLQHVTLVLCRNDARLYDACRPEDGLHMCSSTKKCQRRDIMFEAVCNTDRINCTDDEFRCRFVNRCIPRKSLNTEDGCMLGNKERILLPCRDDEYTCEKSRLCIPRSAVHNGEIDCETREIQDQSDEDKNVLLTCTKHEYTCPESGRCIPRNWVKDGKADCRYPHDEDSPLAGCFDSEFRCVTSGRCLMRYRVVDGFRDCTDGSDELQQLPSCNISTEYRCQDTGRCIPRSWLLDGTENCKDGSDEVASSNMSCTAGEFSCLNGRRCIVSKYLCDGMDHCGDCSDEIEACDEPRMWKCPDDPLGTCIPQSYGCDAYGDCPNGLDNPAYLPGFKCKAVTIAAKEENCAIPQWTLHDGNAICQDRSDVCFQDGEFQCVHCADKRTIIAKRQVCDGLLDCQDLSDECLCNRDTLGSGENETICNAVCYKDDLSDKCKQCEAGEIYCEETDECLGQDTICDGKDDCPSSLDEMYCMESRQHSSVAKNHSFECWPLPTKLIETFTRMSLLSVYVYAFPKYAKRCDGIVECGRFEDECSSSANCATLPDACTKFKLNGMMILEEIIGAKVPILVRTCSNWDTVASHFNFLNYLVGHSICNGVSECPDNADEENCTGRFECDGGTIVWPTGVKKVVSIDMNKTCDLTIDCANATDELNCNNSTHLYCESGSPLFVPYEFRMDGKQDCDDNSDECPPDAYDDNPFSSREEMISNVFLRYIIWIMASLAILGNVGMIVETYISEMDSSSPSSAMSKCNRVMIINLAVSDFLMGIALLIIGSRSFMYSGQYCVNDKPWRVSGLCSGIGVLTVMSSETSVFTLAILTGYRLYGIYRPFDSRNIKVKTAVAAALTAWICSAILALVPLIPVVNQSMVTDALIAPSPYFHTTVVSWDDMHTYAVRLFSLSARNRSSEYGLSNWYNLRNGLKNVYPDFEPEVLGYFGYYSAHGVCIPRLFRIDGTPALHPLSLFAISLNFCGLLFIITSYVLIYVKSSRRSKIVGNVANQERRSQAMQRKITILIATDLCCWLPICFMTFLSQTHIPVSGMAYAVAAILFLPINSSLNPIIYSNGFAVTRNKLRRGYGQINRYARRTVAARAGIATPPSSIPLRDTQSSSSHYANTGTASTNLTEGVLSH